MSKILLRADYDAILANLKPEDVVARECKHVTYSTHRNGEISDMLTIKEYLITKDGMRIPRVTTKENYQRPYWVTKPPFRDHPDKIQFESLDRVDMFRSTQIKLRQDICFRLGQGDPRWGLRMLARSPYLYGLDPGPEVFMKQRYLSRWPDSFAPNKVTVIDAETDTWKDGFQAIMWSLVSDDEVVLYVDAEWAISVPNYVEQIHELYPVMLREWLKPVIAKLSNDDGEYPAYLDHLLNIPMRVEMHNGEFNTTYAMINRLHDTQPDIVTGWNVFFDAEVMEGACLRADRDPADIWSDDRVPYEYRGYYLKKGLKDKLTSSGRKMNLEPQERWNIVLATASWKMQDAMQAYWQLRKAKGKESGGYGLDAVLRRHIGTGKLHFDVGDSKIPGGTLHWHMDMQKNFKVPYGLYNLFDSIGVWVQDKKNNDLSSQISKLAGACDYSKFNSQPTINSIDMLFTSMQKRRVVLNSTSDQMEDENDKYTMSRDGWIVTFPSHNVANTGLFLYEDMPEVQSTVHMMNGDADVETTYPIAEIIQNLGKETTVHEPCRIQGVNREKQRLASINLTAGRVNALEIVQSVCKMPTLSDWEELARKEMV